MSTLLISSSNLKTLDEIQDEWAMKLLLSLRCSVAGCEREMSNMRKGAYSLQIQDRLPLCNAHGLLFANGQFCCGCGEPYRISDIRQEFLSQQQQQNQNKRWCIHTGEQHEACQQKMVCGSSSNHHRHPPFKTHRQTSILSPFVSFCHLDCVKKL